MGLGSTAKKLQKLADVAEKLFERFQEVRAEVQATRETVEETNERMSALEREVAAQRAVLEELAAAEGIDVDAIREEVEAEADVVAPDADADSAET